ncbi:MAG TPA: UDP-N-acetylenolpyruvoylglucosamine reductase [Bdellovibrionales bacterium]|nr:UDP-N-acetylenolpyruvoylglucosamine reductase [Pseudobdellovibrionaceae bacterium]HAG91847.1 UDP-N-acetylenolpyruvoylglucosamine reductase [Bdellovibrionales bacterium]
MKRVILTGSSGFVGSRFLRDFKDHFEMVPISLRTTPPSEIDIQNGDSIVHCAALVHQMNPPPEENYFHVNRDLTLELAQAAKAKGAKHFLFLSTSHVFGDSGTIADHNTSLTPETPCHPTDPYGRSKLAAEEELLKLADSHFTVSILRPPMVYGEGAKGNIRSLVKLVQKIPVLPLGFQHNRRSLIYVGNLCAFMVWVLENGNGSQIYLPQDEKPLSISELTSKIGQALEKQPTLIPIPRFLIFAFHLLNKKQTVRLFGTLALASNSTESQDSKKFTPPYSTQEGLNRMISEMKS